MKWKVWKKLSILSIKPKLKNRKRNFQKAKIKVLNKSKLSSKKEDKEKEKKEPSIKVSEKFG